MNQLPTKKYLALKALMMPKDTNPYGTIFGGVILSFIDQAGAVGAHHEARAAGWPDHPLVSVAMNRVEFHKPVFVGETVSFFTQIQTIGRTAITMHVTVYGERDGREVKLTEAEVTYVAVEIDGKTMRPVPLRAASGRSSKTVE